MPVRPGLSAYLVPEDALVTAVGPISNSVHDSSLEPIHRITDRLTEGRFAPIRTILR